MSRVYQTKLKRLPYSPLQKDLTLQADQDMTGDAFERLARATVHSMPVQDSNGEIIGMLDLSDFARLAVKVFTQNQQGSHLDVRSCMNLSGNDHFVSLAKTATVFDLLKRLDKVHQHRVCLHQKDGRVFAILSQIDVVHYFLQEIASLPFAKIPISKLARKKHLGFGRRKLISVDLKDSVLYALTVLDRNCVTGIPVLNGAGKLCGTFSLADVPQAINCLTYPLETFLKHNQPTFHPFTVTADISFASLLKAFSVSGMHRLWVVQDLKVVSVITLSDVIHCLRTFSRKKL